MTIECYFSSCGRHSCHYDPDNGPFCDEPKCVATSDEIAFFEIERRNFLERIYNENKETGDSSR
jgi:hypothetical protein